MSTQSSGIGLAGTLFVVFLILRLTGVIAWSWWWVTAPLWIPFGLLLLVLVPVAIVVYVMHRKERKRAARYFARVQGRW